MAEDAALPWAEALTILRVVRRWTRSELAQQAGLQVTSIAKFERGSKTPSLETRQLLVAAMGYPPRLLDRTVSFVRWARVERELYVGAGQPALSAWLDRLTVEAGGWMEGLARQLLMRLLRDVREQADGSGADGATPATDAGIGSSRPEKARSDRGSLPVDVVLVILRVIRRSGQQDLAESVGARKTSISSYELGKTVPRMLTLNRIVEGMGFPPGMLDRTLGFVQLAASALESHMAISDDPTREAIEQVVAAQARRAEDWMAVCLEGLVWVARVQLSRWQAPLQWECLQRVSEDAQRALVCEGAEFHTVGLCELICDKSLEAAGGSAREAALLADLALLIAARVPGDAAFRCQLEGYARCHIANAMRVAGDDLVAAEKSFHAALQLWRSGAGADQGLLNEARVLHLETSLRRAQRRIPDALALLNKALVVDRWGETTALLLSKAKALEESGDFSLAERVLREVSSRIDPQQEPWKFYIVQKNLAATLCHLGQYGQAALMLPNVHALAMQFGKPLEQIRVIWLEGKIAFGLGRTKEAASLLARARQQFARHKDAYDAALVTLELAQIHAALGRTAEVKVLAEKSAPIFAAQQVHAEAQRALDLFRRAAAEERATGSFLSGLIQYLYRARHNPQLPFEGTPA